MKKAYSPEGVRNHLLQRQARRWYRAGYLRTEQLAETRRLFPDPFYHAHWWVKVALFAFTLLLNGCATSLGGALLAPLLEAGTVAAGLALLAYGTGLYFLLDALIRARRLYHSGIDNALLYSMVVALAGGLCLIASEVYNDAAWLFTLLSLPPLVGGANRYASRALTLGAVIALVSTVALLALEFPLGKALLPFLLMGLAAGLYGWLRAQYRRPDAFYWASCLPVGEAAALVLGYLAGNYVVVREGAALLNGQPGPVPFGVLFYGLTALLPLGYLYTGLRFRDRLRVWVGLAGLMASLLTLQYYTARVPYPWFLVLAGAGLLFLSIGLLRALRVPWRGLSAQPDALTRSADSAETLVTAQVGTPPPAPDPLFGGGQFGGGGAGTGY
jgi:hypothetical protein